MRINLAYLLTLTLASFSIESSVENIREEIAERYQEWRAKFNPDLNGKFPEDSLRAFMENLASTESHNRFENKTYEQGLNEFSFLSFEEKLSRHAGLIKPERTKRCSRILPKQFNNTKSLPFSVNYTRYFSEVKNQGACQSCWAFTAVSVIEYFMRKTGRKWIFSEQNLVDCSALDYGCTGGWPTNAFKYIRDEGISNGTRYPYRGVKQSCLRVGKKRRAILKVKNVCEVFLNGREDLLKRIVAQYGPVSSGVLTTEGFTNYKSGVFNDIRCSNHTIDHAVTIVGYGTDKRQGDYWIIRNSWGVSWGMRGYGLIARNKNSMCGIALYAMFPCLEPNG